MSNEDYVIISVIGPHAGETEQEIFLRKIKEIENTGKSFWLHRSHGAKPDLVQRFAEESVKRGKSPFCFFIEPSSKGGAWETTKAEVAKEFSQDGINWERIPKGILATGLIKNAYALVFDQFRLIERETLDLWDYSLFDHPGDAVRLRQGASTICCIKISSRERPQKIASNIRKIVAIGRITPPFSVRLR